MNCWSSSSTLGAILSGPSDLLGLSVLSLLKTVAGVMTTSGKHTQSELLAQLRAGILSNVSFFKAEEKNKVNACEFCSSVFAVMPFPNISLLIPFFTFNDVFPKFIWVSFTFFCNIYFKLFS